MTLDAVETNRWTLRFSDRDLERQFQDEFADSSRLQIRYGWVVYLLVVLAFAALDPVDDVRLYTWEARYAVSIPVTVLGVAMTFAGRERYRRLWAWVTWPLLFLALSNNNIAWLAVAARVPQWTLARDPWLIAFGVGTGLVAVLGGPTVGGFRFLYGTSLTTALVTGYIVSFWLLDTGPRGLLLASVLLVCGQLGAAFGGYRFELIRRRLFIERRQLAEERAKSEVLLLNVLPAAIAERLKSDPSHIADGFTEVTILFADIVGFTDLSARLSPAEVVAMLNRLFRAFDDLADEHGLEKIKTIGDAYMVVGGVPEARSDHAEAIIAMALGMRDAVAEVAIATGLELKVRIGANTGPVVAGVIGKRKFAYDLWGDAVNTASRMESHGVPGEIQISASTHERVKDAFVLESRGMIPVKGKGELPTWFVKGARSRAERARSMTPDLHDPP